MVSLFLIPTLYVSAVGWVARAQEALAHWTRGRGPAPEPSQP